MKFTLVAYKPDSSCICMGNVTDTYSSDFHISHHEDMRSLVAKRIEYSDYKCDEQELDYEITILCDGVPFVQWPLGLIHEFVKHEHEVKIEVEEARVAAKIEADRVALEEAEEKRVREAAAQITRDKQTLLSLAEKLNCNVTPK